MAVNPLARTFISPVGGHVLNSGLAVPVGQWTGDWQGRPAEATQSDMGGFTGYRVNLVDPKWTFTLLLDDADMAVAAGFVPSMVLARVAFKLGALTRADVCEWTTVFGIQRNCNPMTGEIVSVTVNGGGGILTLDTGI